jgi:predicted ATPase
MYDFGIDLSVLSILIQELPKLTVANLFSAGQELLMCASLTFYLPYLFLALLLVGLSKDPRLQFLHDPIFVYLQSHT